MLHLGVRWGDAGGHRLFGRAGLGSEAPQESVALDDGVGQTPWSIEGQKEFTYSVAGMYGSSYTKLWFTYTGSSFFSPDVEGGAWSPRGGGDHVREGRGHPGEGVATLGEGGKVTEGRGD